MELDYAILPGDGVYNMDIEEAAECARLIKAKHNIIVHLKPGELFDREKAEAWDAPDKIIVEPGQEIFLYKSLASAQQPDDVNNIDKSNATDVLSGEIVITFDYEKQSGSASNQFAVWIENMDGQLVKTLYATRYTANGGYKDRPDSIAVWVEKSDLASMQKSDVDAITGATPKAGSLSYTWDLTDADGVLVSPDKYFFMVEGTLRWKNYVLYSGVIDVSAAAVTVTADAEFFYETSDRYDALTDNSPENSMISFVTASFVPIKNE
jgi:hypothetical protein